ncbi:MAG TPA: hypothetical protein VNH83_22300 [Bryobacteraceae bacterium]|nr:hypothetical protein [Bryobacteraceae bacterium]
MLHLLQSELSAVPARLFNIIHSDAVKRYAISAFLLFHLLVIGSWSLPPSTRLDAFIRNAVAPYAWRSGLAQSWDMFAPNPLHANTYIEAEITYRNGQVRTWTFPQMQELGYAERYAKERYRKFANDRLRLDEYAVLWPDAARYIARLNGDASNPPRTVNLLRYWSLISPPPPPGEEEQTPHWERHLFFTYTVKPGDLS